MNKNLLISLFSAGTKVIGTVVLVAILARVFSLSAFGNFTYSLTLGTIFSLLVDYGYNMKVIKDVSLHGADVRKIAANALFSKIILFFFAFGLLILGQVFLDDDREIDLASIYLFISLSFFSFSNTFLSVFKGLKRYLTEFKIVAFDNLLTFLAVSLMAFLSRDIVYTSLTFLLAKLCTFVFSLRMYISSFELIRPTIDMIKNDMLEAVPYAVHYWVGNAYLNVDTIIMESFVDAEKIGIYQSGIRIVMGLGILLTAINAVYLPLFNEARARGTKNLIKTVKSVNGKIILFAFSMGLFMVIFSKWIILTLFGRKFLELNEFFWVFALIVFLRIIGASFGILLTISNKQAVRALAGFLSILLIIGLNYYYIPKEGYMVAAYILLAAHVFITLFYILSVYLEHRSFFIPKPKDFISFNPNK